jgi:hypothetical protein
MQIQSTHTFKPNYRATATKQPGNINRTPTSQSPSDTAILNARPATKPSESPSTPLAEARVVTTPETFSSSPKPWKLRLRAGESTGYHTIRETSQGENVLDTSDACALNAPASDIRHMLEGDWTREWWGGSSETEMNQPSDQEISNFDFIPEKRLGLPLARLNISLFKPTKAEVEGTTVYTYSARLNPRSGQNPGDKEGEIVNTGDIDSKMLIHVVERQDGTSVIQLDWNHAKVEPEPAIPGGKIIDKLVNPSRTSGGLGLLNWTKKGFIGIVGGGHNKTMRPEKGQESGFGLMRNRLGGQGDLVHVPVEQADPERASAAVHGTGWNLL